MSNVKRYIASGYMDLDNKGVWVSFEDHQRELAEKDARIAELEKELVQAQHKNCPRGRHTGLVHKDYHNQIVGDLESQLSEAREGFGKFKSEMAQLGWMPEPESESLKNAVNSAEALLARLEENPKPGKGE